VGGKKKISFHPDKGCGGELNAWVNATTTKIKIIKKK